MDEPKSTMEAAPFIAEKRRGPGNPHLIEWSTYKGQIREAMKEAVTPEVLVGVMRMLATKAIRDGSIPAAKELLNRYLGNQPLFPREVTPLGMDLPTLTTPEAVQTALSALLHSVTSGTVTSEEGVRIGALLELARKSIETKDLAERLSALEDHVRPSFGGRHSTAAAQAPEDEP